MALPLGVACLDERIGVAAPLPTLAALLSLALPAGATRAKQPVNEYVPKNAKAHCKSHYVKKTKTVKKHNLVKLRETVCVHQAPRAKANPKAVALTVHLHAHLNQSFVQDPANPLHVTYSDSASATVGLGASRETAEPNLPVGILALYSDGLLDCWFEVGGTTTGGACPVTYSGRSAHRCRDV